jgi:hypothetical protein
MRILKQTSIALQAVTLGGVALRNRGVQLALKPEMPLVFIYGLVVSLYQRLSFHLNRLEIFQLPDFLLL